jgi:hypothetical protein
VEIEGKVWKLLQQDQPLKGTELLDTIAEGNLSRAKLPSGRTKTVEVCRFEPWFHIGCGNLEVWKMLVILWTRSVCSLLLIERPNLKDLLLTAGEKDSPRTDIGTDERTNM